MPTAIGEFERVRQEALRFRLKWRSAQRAGQAAVEATGMPWESALALTDEIGVPGKSQESQNAWLELAQGSVIGRDSGFSVVDWNALIQALLANLPALLSICGL